MPDAGLPESGPLPRLISLSRNQTRPGAADFRVEVPVHLDPGEHRARHRGKDSGSKAAASSSADTSAGRDWMAPWICVPAVRGARTPRRSAPRQFE